MTARTYIPPSRPNGDMARWRTRTAPAHVFFWYLDIGQHSPGAHAMRGHRSNEIRWDLANEERAEKWIARTNALLAYLSDGQFQLDLRDIQTRVGTFPEECRDLDQLLEVVQREFTRGIEGFKMVVAVGYPRYTCSGVYWGNGSYLVKRESLSLGEEEFPHKGYDVTGLHEMSHGLIGTDHCGRQHCFMRPNLDTGELRLCKKDRETLGWPKRDTLNAL